MFMLNKLTPLLVRCHWILHTLVLYFELLTIEASSCIKEQSLNELYFILLVQKAKILKTTTSTTTPSHPFIKLVI